MSVEFAGPIAYLSQSQSAVYFSKGSVDAGTFQSSPKGTAAPIRKLQNLLDVAYWGEDNRFPQNIEQQMAYCGVGKAGLDWKARALWGSGIIPGKIIDYTDNGKTEVFQPLKVDKYKPVYNFIQARSFFRWAIEYFQDWTWYSNCWSETILSNDAKTITGLVHQESCDCRYKQMDDDGNFTTMFLSKMWGLAQNQYAKFDPKKSIPGLIANPVIISQVDNKFVKQLDCVDMYDPLNSLTKIAAKKKDKKGFKSAILPVNYPSVNKTYYQVPSWDGARLSGWVEIASKIPTMIKTLYNKAFKIKYHIEVPETFFERKYGTEKWFGMTEDQQKAARVKLLNEMDQFLAGEENAFNSFISFFDVDPHERTEYGRVKIQAIEDKTNIDKEVITQSAADLQVLIAMGVHPTLFSAGMTGSMLRSGGGSGSDIREAFLVYNALLNLERNVLMEPLYLVRDFNRVVGGMKEWEEDIVFRVRDTVLTTLDQGKGTAKVVS